MAAKALLIPGKYVKQYTEKEVYSEIVVEDTYKGSKVIIRNLYIKLEIMPNLNDRF
ncbi:MULTISPECIES: hypothetical protein [unclassified Nostoc]|uniref:hypothetical protein n=1 Tax=unclassified Nostoc TaxID=2593658 RepID=UPI0015E38992|nr:MULTISPECIES: hypothetical protein [unclassified Nostoc]